LWPVLEVAIRLDGPEPQLKARIQAALNGAPVRLARIAVEREVASPAPAVPSQRLEDLSEGEVFRQAYVRARGHPPSAEVAELFAEVQHAVDAAGANGAEPEDAKVKA
ncbi:MAG TPA: exonuclease SbcCD subunit D C-terminal domain-containing protein, partial [Myxococcales bacterium LLY-WYZ-16_1]|nr:exonuclease SbcCD subunit D C-terminal domain-containing protein [Myxococcales bacterium LLY-WYZ-16_1]